MSFYEIIGGRVEVAGFRSLLESRDGGNFDETQHPRDDHGKFIEGSGEWTAENLNGKTTQEAYSKGGVYDANREAFQNGVVSRTLGDAQPPVGRQPTAIMLGGGTASGKSSGSEKIGLGDAANPDMVHLDPDSIKPQFPEWNGLVAEDMRTAAARTYKEAGTINEKAVAACIDKGLDVKYDGTMSGPKGFAALDAFDSNNYNVQAVFFDIPTAVAQERAISRAETSTRLEDKGRYVPPQVIEDAHWGSANAFVYGDQSPTGTAIKDDPRISYKALYDNSEQGNPKLVYERFGMGEEKIHDQEKWDMYRLKGAGRPKKVS
jgi:hypothetical protein